MKKVLSILSLFTLLYYGCSITKTINTTNRDGSSFEMAIIVSSVSEEYEHIKNICSDCKFIQQALVFEKGKPFDILTFEKPNGEEIEYYFDKN